MSIRLGTSMMRRTRPRFLRTRKLDWTTDGIDFLRLYGRRGGTPRDTNRAVDEAHAPPLEAALTASARSRERGWDPRRAGGPPGILNLRRADERAWWESSAHKTRTDGRDLRLCRRHPGGSAFPRRER